MLVEAESLFNDGTAAVLFGIALTLSTGGHVAPTAMAAVSHSHTGTMTISVAPVRWKKSMDMG